jgi:N utilization substance protein B
MSRHMARLAAVQVMYQINILNDELDKAISSFIQYIKDEKEYDRINIDFFKSLVNKFKEDIDFDNIISKNLNVGKSIESISIITKSIMQVGIIEMTFEETASSVIINEYVEIAKEFVDDKNVKFINAILDKIAKQIRICNK